MTQEVEITRTYNFPAVPDGWEWENNGGFVVLFDDDGDRFGKVAIEADDATSFCESTTTRWHPSMLAAAADLAAEAAEWQAVIDAENASAPVIDGYTVYVHIPLALRRKGWRWCVGEHALWPILSGTETSMRVDLTGLTGTQALDAMADLVSDAETTK